MSKARAGKPRMMEIFESWELRLYRKLEEVDLIVNRMMTEMDLESVPKDLYRPFLQERFADMVDQIAEQREARMKCNKGA